MNIVHSVKLIERVETPGLVARLFRKLAPQNFHGGKSRWQQVK
jgi:hypothetical protein